MLKHLLNHKPSASEMWSKKWNHKWSAFSNLVPGCSRVFPRQPAPRVPFLLLPRGQHPSSPSLSPASHFVQILPWLLWNSFSTMKGRTTAKLKSRCAFIKKNNDNQVLPTCVLERKVSLKILSFHPHYYINNINYILTIKTVLLFWFLLYDI